ncbi:Ubiquitin-like protein DskB [Trichuris trichiura]|uniref:Ubiquitin-like protein DskB n=1 Tax=Trichuris trichiura TaxID=36087 RepID=A0A077Z030_TRITR|nr:Ubiquitin-like protein DskB [Trichuris trichiura]
MSVSFSVLSFTDGQFTLRMDGSEIVRQIKRRIEVMAVCPPWLDASFSAGLPSEVQRLVYRNRELGDQESIDSAGIVDGAIVHLVIDKHLIDDANNGQRAEINRLLDTDSLATSDECEHLDLTFTKEREADAHRRAKENLQTMERMRALRADMERVRFLKQQRRPQIVFRREAEGYIQSSHDDDQPSLRSFFLSTCNTEDTSAKESSAGETELEEPLQVTTKSSLEHSDNAAADQSPSSDLFSSCSDAEQESSVVCSSELDPSVVSDQEDIYFIPDELNCCPSGFYDDHCEMSDEGPSRESARCGNGILPTEYQTAKGRSRHLSTTAGTEDLASDPSELSSGMIIANAYRKYRAKRRPHPVKGTQKRIGVCTANNSSFLPSSVGGSSSKNCIADQGRASLLPDAIQRRNHAYSKVPTSDGRQFQRQVSKNKQRPSASRVESSTCESSSDEKDLFASDRIMQAVESIFEKKCSLTTRKANQDVSTAVSVSPASSHVVRTRKQPQSSQSQQRCKVCGCKLAVSMAFRCRCGKTLCTRHKAPKFHPCFESRSALEVRSFPANNAGPSSDSDRLPGPIS